MQPDENAQGEAQQHDQGQGLGPGQAQLTDMDPLRLPIAVLIDDPRYRIKPMQQVISALIGGLITTMVVTPLEVVKTRVQTQHAMRQRPTVSKLCYVFHNGLMTHICKPHATECLPSPSADAAHMRPLRGAMDAFLKILCGSGITGLWSGLSPTLVSALPSTIIYFLTYEYLKHSFANLYYVSKQPVEGENGGGGGTAGKGGSGGSEVAFPPPRGGGQRPLDTSAMAALPLPYMVPMASGMCARTVVVTAITPIEMVRIKMQSGYITYPELWLVLRSLIKSHGLLGLWRGWPPTVMRDAPFSGTYWAAYESLKRAFNVSEPTFWFSFLTGAASGALATWVTMPFDLVTTHTQIELGQDELYGNNNNTAGSKDANAAQRKGSTATTGAGKARQSVFNRLGLIYRQQGVRGLYIGVVPRMLRVVPACAIMISTFEYSKAFFFHYNLDLQETGK